LNREQLLQALDHYSTPFSEEVEFIKKFQTLLQHPRAYCRDHLPGHMTGSAWIIDENKHTALLVYHAKLKRWLQPGGHADGEEDIVKVALTEAEEETGLHHLIRLSEGIFDIDIHTIPTRPDIPEHLHYDVRILFRASAHAPLSISEESHALAWVPFTDLPEITGHNHSMSRMAEKVLKLFPGQEK
jgi:8-oxo-dGTP pyrophosphatase MutT (NUDIX family)